MCVALCLYLCCLYLDFDRRVFHMCFFFQAEDGIRDLVRSRGLGDVYKRQVSKTAKGRAKATSTRSRAVAEPEEEIQPGTSALVLSLIHI